MTTTLMDGKLIHEPTDSIYT